jgi:hypothetical protein
MAMVVSLLYSVVAAIFEHFNGLRFSQQKLMSLPGYLSYKNRQKINELARPWTTQVVKIMNNSGQLLMSREDFNKWKLYSKRGLLVDGISIRLVVWELCIAHPARERSKT